MVMANESTEVIEEIIPLDPSQEYDTIVIGAGAAGIGAAIALMHAGVEKFFVVDRETVGASFAKWPAETRFITPSFPSNSIGMLDLNSIAVGVSPAFSMKVEHPTGQQYAQHLNNLATFFEIPILEHTNVNAIEKHDGLYHLHFDEGSFMTKNVIWAAGEFQYPKTDAFEGAELCRHTATVPSYAELDGDDFLVIGGYESGVDAAYHLADNGKKVHVFDRADPWGEGSSNPSIALATFTIERTRHACFAEHVTLHANNGVERVTFSDGMYELTTSNGDTFQTATQPLFAGGFEGSHTFVSHLFESRDDGFPELSDRDESTTHPGMFLCGPAIRHGNENFCFIYKYRQRFAVVAQAIASSLGHETDDFVEAYRGWGMYLDDLSCCGQECLTC